MTSLTTQSLWQFESRIYSLLRQITFNILNMVPRPMKYEHTLDSVKNLPNK